MLRKFITYTSLDGQQITEEFLFNLSKADAIEMEAAEEGQLQAKLTRIASSNKMSEIYPMIKEFILVSYGKRSPDGKRFVKSRDIRAEFEGSLAYDVLLNELLASEDEGAAITAFFQAIMPGSAHVTQGEPLLETPLLTDPQPKMVEEPPTLTVDKTTDVTQPVSDPTLHSDKTMSRATMDSLPVEELNRRLREGWVVQE